MAFLYDFIMNIKEALEDAVFERYQTYKALEHINNILVHYNRTPHNDFNEAMRSIESIGLYHPFADSSKYLNHMKFVSNVNGSAFQL